MGHKGLEKKNTYFKSTDHMDRAHPISAVTSEDKKCEKPILAFRIFCLYGGL